MCIKRRWWPASGYPARGGRRTNEVRTFETTTAALLQLADWLTEPGVRHMVMESTGLYWKPVFNILEGHFQVILVNAQHYKAVSGRKTDVKDSEWLAQLLEHGLLRASFIPPRPIRELRDLMRYRNTLIQARASEINRLHKLLKSANLKVRLGNRPCPPHLSRGSIHAVAPAPRREQGGPGYGTPYPGRCVSYGAAWSPL